MSLRGRGQESGLKAALLDWCKNRIGHYKGVQLTNLTTSWKDGLAFCALVHSIDPTAIDYDAMKPNEGLKNCKIAFAAAQKLGISALLDAEDVADIDCPEPLSMMTYISQYYHHVNGTGRNWNGSLRGATPEPPAVAAARGHGLMRGSVDISAMELKRMRGDEPAGSKPAAAAPPAQEKAQAPVSYVPRPDLARTGSFRGSALGRQQGLTNARAASPSPQAARAATLAPPQPVGLSRQVSTPDLRTDDRAAEEKRKPEERARQEEDRKRQQADAEARRKESEAQAIAEKRKQEELEAKRKESEERALAEKRRSEKELEEKRRKEAMERDEAAKRAKLQQQQETERRLAEQKRRDEERQRASDEKRQRQASVASQGRPLTEEEERKKARLARWAAESEQEPSDVSLAVTNASVQSAANVDGEVRIKCLDDGAEWVVPVNTVSQVGFEGAVKSSRPSRVAAPTKSGEVHQPASQPVTPTAAPAQSGSSCIVM